MKTKKTDLKTEMQNQIIEYLTANKKYNEVDLPMISAYVSEANTIEAMDLLLEKDGLFLTAPNGILYPHPAQKTRNLASKNLMSMGRLLGITPLARKMANVDADSSLEFDQFSEFD